MSLYDISQNKFIEELSKVIPEWEVEITPKDYVESPQNYNMPKVIVILKNKKFSSIVLEKSLQTNGRKDEYGNSLPLTTPWHLGGIYTIIAAAIHPDNCKKHERLFTIIAEHFSKFFEEKKQSLECSD